MPTQDNEDLKKQPETGVDEHKSEHLLPLFNASFDNYMDKLDDFLCDFRQFSTVNQFTEHCIGRFKPCSFFLKFSNFALRPTNFILNFRLTLLKIIKANEDKIESIDEKQISKLESGIKRNKEKISKLDDRIAITQLKSEKLKCFSNVLKSFMTLNPQKRREMFRESMDGLRKSTKS